MLVQDLINKGVCGAGETKGFNTDKGCADVIKAAHSVWLISPSVVITNATDFTLAYVKSLQKSGDLVVIKGINTFEENGSDDAFETLDDDTKILTNKGKYNFMATFTHGMYFHEALGSIEGHGNWRTIYVDNEGTIAMTYTAEGIKGFRTGQITRKKLQFPTNSTGLKQGLEWQLIERFELDDYSAVLHQEILGFDPRQVEPVVQVDLSFVNAPADTDTTLTVKAVIRRGRKDAVSGALFGQWLNTIDGVTSNPTGGDDSATSGTYVLTVPALAAAESGAIRLFNNGSNESVIEIAGDDSLYRSNTLTYTVSV